MFGLQESLVCKKYYLQGSGLFGSLFCSEIKKVQVCFDKNNVIQIVNCKNFKFDLAKKSGVTKKKKVG